MKSFERKIFEHPGWERVGHDEQCVCETERNWLWENIYSKIIPGQPYIMRVSGKLKDAPSVPYTVLLRTENGRETLGNNLLVLPIDYSEHLHGRVFFRGNKLFVLQGDRILYFKGTKRVIEESNLKFIPLTEENAHEVQEPEIT